MTKRYEAVNQSISSELIKMFCLDRFRNDRHSVADIQSGTFAAYMGCGTINRVTDGKDSAVLHIIKMLR